MCPKCKKYEKVKGYNYCGRCINIVRAEIKKAQKDSSVFVYVNNGRRVEVL